MNYVHNVPRPSVNESHDKQELPWHITQMCFRGCLSPDSSLHYRDSSLNSGCLSDTCGHWQAFHCDRRCVLANSIKYWVWWKMMKKWTWKWYYPTALGWYSSAPRARFLKYGILNQLAAWISLMSSGVSFYHLSQNVFHIFYLVV